MPTRRLPNTMPAVLRTLKTARDTYKATNAAERAISAAQFASLDDTVPTSLLNRILKEASDVDLAQAAQTPLTTQVSQTGARLTMHVSHFHQVLDLGITRGYFAAGARAYYGRDVHGTSIPDLSNYTAVEEAAGRIMSGETARAQAEGGAHKAMVLPNASEVATLAGQFNTLHTQSRNAQTNTDKQREEAQALYPEAQALAVDICDTVEFFYRKDPDASSRRQKCARWGVVYMFDAGETPDPAPGGGGTPPPANP